MKDIVTLHSVNLTVADGKEKDEMNSQIMAKNRIIQAGSENNYIMAGSHQVRTSLKMKPKFTSQDVDKLSH